MIASEDTTQQQLHYLQSCGFGGLWRFAGHFTQQQKPNDKSGLLPIAWLKAEFQHKLSDVQSKKPSCLPLNLLDGDDDKDDDKICSNLNLSSSMSSLVLDSPTEKEFKRDPECGSTSSLDRMSTGKQRRKKNKKGFKIPKKSSNKK